MNNDGAIGIDLGGTRIKGVALDADGAILHHLYVPTQDGGDAAWKNAVAETVKDLTEKTVSKKCAVGISAPGLPNGDHSAISFMPGRMQGLENFVWSQFLKVPVWVLNDAVAALFSESRIGAAKDIKNVAMLTLGTGVGGAILIDGKPYHGAFGKAGHFGHMVINDEGGPDITGMPGSLEDCIGNCTIEKRSRGKFLSTHRLLEAYRQGDGFASEIWHRSVRQLAIGLASITNILSPEAIVIGGGITEAGGDLFSPLSGYLAEYEWRTGGNGVRIIKASQGDLSGAVGAAFFAMDKIKSWT